MNSKTRYVLASVISLAVGFVSGVYLTTKRVGMTSRVISISAVWLIEQTSIRQVCAGASIAEQAIADHLAILERERQAIGEVQYKNGRTAALARLALVRTQDPRHSSAAEWSAAESFCRTSGFNRCTRDDLTQLWGPNARTCKDVDATAEQTRNEQGSEGVHGAAGQRL